MDDTCVCVCVEATSNKEKLCQSENLEVTSSQFSLIHFKVCPLQAQNKKTQTQKPRQHPLPPPPPPPNTTHTHSDTQTAHTGTQKLFSGVSSSGPSTQNARQAVGAVGMFDLAELPLRPTTRDSPPPSHNSTVLFVLAWQPPRPQSAIHYALSRSPPKND